MLYKQRNYNKADACNEKNRPDFFAEIVFPFYHEGVKQTNNQKSRNAYYDPVKIHFHSSIVYNITVMPNDQLGVGLLSISFLEASAS